MELELPDEPRWLEARWMLRSGGHVVRHGDGCLVLDRRPPISGSVVSTPGDLALERELAGAPAVFELLVQVADLDEVTAQLPGWVVSLAVLHEPAEPFDPATPMPGVEVSIPPSVELLAAVGAGVDDWEARCDALAVAFVDGRAVASCQAAVDETRWDVGVDTYDAGDRRRGHATAAFLTLAGHLAARGHQPVWGAAEDNEASLCLAAKLGFEPVDRLAVLTPPTGDPQPR